MHDENEEKRNPRTTTSETVASVHVLRCDPPDRDLRAQRQSPADPLWDLVPMRGLEPLLRFLENGF